MSAKRQVRNGAAMGTGRHWNQTGREAMGETMAAASPEARGEAEMYMQVPCTYRGTSRQSGHNRVVVRL
jgi:chorismate-pyruvate lyase